MPLGKEMHPCGIKAQGGGSTPSKRQSMKPWIKTEECQYILELNAE